jgi:hypothetical protein
VKKSGSHTSNIQHAVKNKLAQWAPSLIYDVPEDISANNIEATILTQSPELQLLMESIRPKYYFKNKKQFKNIIAEVEPKTRQILTQMKVKFGCQLCNVVRCFRCSKYGHEIWNAKARKCAHAARGNILQECSAPERELKYVNCMTHNRVDENHSSMNKECNSLHNLIRRYRQNTEYYYDVLHKPIH